MPNLGPMEILMVLVVALIVLGPKRLPEAGRQVGKALGEVKKWSTSVQGEMKSVLDFDAEAAPPKAWNPDASRPETLDATPAPPPVAEAGDPTSMGPDAPPPPE
jgi:sec-independent protein translocase protein TatA